MSYLTYSDIPFCSKLRAKLGLKPLEVTGGSQGRIFLTKKSEKSRHLYILVMHLSMFSPSEGGGITPRIRIKK